MRHAPQFDAFVNEHGRELLGTTDRGLSVQDALAAVAIARAEGVPILGGDVYVLECGRHRPAHANWFTDRGKGESDADHARRSWFESEAFLRTTRFSEYNEPLVALVRAVR